MTNNHRRYAVKAIAVVTGVLALLTTCLGAWSLLISLTLNAQVRPNIQVNLLLILNLGTGLLLLMSSIALFRYKSWSRIGYLVYTLISTVALYFVFPSEMLAGMLLGRISLSSALTAQNARSAVYGLVGYWIVVIFIYSFFPREDAPEP